MEWVQVLTIIGSVLVPTLSGFAWMIHRMDYKFEKIDRKFEKIDADLMKINERINAVEIKLTNIDMRVGFLERLFEMSAPSFKIGHNKERTDP